MTAKPDCELCTLNRKMVFGTGNVEGKYLAIMDTPATGDLESMKLGSGSGGKLLKKIFAARGVDEHDIYFASMLMCRPPKRDATDREFSSCNRRFLSELEQCNPERILVCGGQTIKQLFDSSVYHKRSLPFTYEGGGTLPDKFKGKTVVCTYSPNYVLRSNEYFIDLCEDVTKLTHPEAFPKYDSNELSTYTVCQSEDEVYRLLSVTLASYEKLAFDIETDGLEEKGGVIRCLGIGTDKECYVIRGEFFTDRIKRILAWLSRRVKIIAHFSNFEYKWMFHHGCDIVISSDTLLLHHEVDERKTRRKLKWLGTRYFNVPDWSDILGEGEGATFDVVPEHLLFPYLAHDIKLTYMLDTKFKNDIEAPPEELYNFIMRSRRVLSKMTQYGIPVDREHLFTLYYTMEHVAENDTQYIRDSIENEKFNPRSSKMVSQVLFEELGFPRIEGDKTGKKTMHQLRYLFPDETIISKIDDTRKLLSAQSTFVKGIYKLTDPNTSKVHGEFRQDTTATGRLSSVDPNLQNIQRKGEIGVAIRNAFIPPEGYDYIGEADYSQIEVYFAAILSKDKAMLELLGNGGDIYRKAASEFYGKRQEDITDLEREYFKPIILGSLYLRSAKAIAEQNHTDVAEEQAKQDLFFSMYKGYYEYAYGKFSGGIVYGSGRGECLVPGALERAKRDKCIRTMFGRKRRFPCIFQDNTAEIRREALNSGIQGTASDVNLYSLCEMYEQAEKGNFLDQFRPWNIIHDANLFWFTEEFKPKCKEFVSNIMLNPPLDLPIKLKIDFKIGKRWGELTKWKE